MAISPRQLIPLLIEDAPEQQTSLPKLTTPAGYQLEFDESFSHQKLNRILSILK